MKKFFSLVLLSCCSLYIASAQFAPQAGISGSTAVPASSPLIINWASSCILQRGYMDISQPSMGYVSAGDSTMAVGPSDNQIVSLGDSGVATLTFPHPVIDLPGADFVIFENGFPNPLNAEEAFLELGFVEVSSDGIHFFRFPATSLTQTSTQIAGSGMYMDARNVNNLAGKYIAGYGTPFDLDEMAGISGLDVHHITHVRIVDVIGALNGYGTSDQNGNRINDPYNTPFPTGGFDLDAVGVIHQQAATAVMAIPGAPFRLYPNPATDKIYIELKENRSITLNVIDLSGRVCLQKIINASTYLQLEDQLTNGTYFFQLTDSQGNQWTERIVKL